jgi:hypothetical protein
MNDFKPLWMSGMNDITVKQHRKIQEVKLCHGY